MPSVFLYSPINSTMFTTCCEVAICDDQANCPVCKQEIDPRSAKDRWFRAYGRAKRYGYGHYGLRRYQEPRDA